jgi:PTH1 family peptidyl-tRNA hydrolase
VGLGNPGPRYLESRHNVGFRTVELLARLLKAPLRRPLFRSFRLGSPADRSVWLVQPLTFMNRSGDIFPALWSFTGGGASSLVVVCDTLDLPPGQCRLRRGGSSAGHKGLASVIARLGDPGFLRLYIGIGRPPGREEVVDFVLGRAAAPESEALERGVRRAAEGILELLRSEPEKVMNALNQKADQS